MKFNGTTIFLWLLFLTCGVCGAVLLWRGVQSAVLLQRAKSWPTTRGTITACKLEEKRKPNGRTAGELTIRYTYQVNGKAYENDRLSFDYDSLHSYQAMQRVEEKLKGVKQIDVYYNPTNPQMAAISCNTNGEVYGILALAITALAFTLGIGVYLLAPYPILRPFLGEFKVETGSPGVKIFRGGEATDFMNQGSASPFRLHRRIGPHRSAAHGADATGKAEGAVPFVEPERRFFWQLELITWHIDTAGRSRASTSSYKASVGRWPRLLFLLRNVSLVFRKSSSSERS